MERKAIESMVKKQWSRKAVGAEAVSKNSTEMNTKKAGKEKVRVAILDSGLDETSDVNLAGSISFTSDDSVKDITGHGTMVTNIIASNHNGISKSGIIPADSPIEIYSVRVLDEKNEAPVSRVLEALQWCMENDINIIHMSFGMNADSEIMHSMIKKAEKAGILMIAAVGDNGEKDYNKVQYPAAYEEVIGVGSVDEDMKHSSFSATGAEVELVAPGENVPISSYWEQNGVGSGTSYAAPHVTVVAAMLWSKDTEKSAEFIRSLLHESAKDLGDGDKYGNGLVDYEYASELFKSFLPRKKEVKENTTKVKSYEVDECLKASWEYDGHKGLIKVNSKLDEHRIKIIRYASYYVDTELASDEYEILHACDNTNYVVATKCFYQESQQWNKGANKVLYEFVDENYSYLSYDEKQDLKIAMRKATNIDFQTGIKECSKEKGKLQLLGLAIHVAGDTYAHKSMCDGSTAGVNLINNIYGVNTSQLKPYLLDGDASIEAMITATKAGTLTTAGMREYFKDKKEELGKKAGAVCNKYYTDSTIYMQKRYTVGTKVATNKLLSYYMEEKAAITPYVFCPYEQDGGYYYKLYRLRTYMNAAGFYFANYTTKYTEAQWNALSSN